VALLLGVSSAPAAAEWTAADTAREAVYLGLHVADWGQTLDIENHPNIHETNPILGEDPNRSAINAFFVGTGLLHAGISYILPRPYREVWQYVSIGYRFSYVEQNHNLGLKFGF
jgi:hypothetical protein